VQGNFIGTSGLGNAIGVEIIGSLNRIGGTNVGSRNTVSGNRGPGVRIIGSNNSVQGNFIGPDNRDGIFIDSGSSNNTIGGVAAGARNIISGNHNVGVSMLFFGSGNGNIIQGNLLDNSGDGVYAAEGINIVIDQNTVKGGIPYCLT
jgi:hypothetical protein